MRLLDLFCGAGGCSMGYHRAGFDVVGVDLNPQPHYPFEFYKADALTFPLGGFDVIHASPPCQVYSRASSESRARGTEYPDLVGEVRQRLQATGVPYVIENVSEAGLCPAVKLCGSMFGLDVMRHRFFESNLVLLSQECSHGMFKNRFFCLDGKRRHKVMSKIVGVYGSVQYKGDFENRCKAMGIDWMTNKELCQAIPPAYTEYIGKQLLSSLQTHRG